MTAFCMHRRPRLCQLLACLAAGCSHFASARCSVFDHWETMTYDPLKDDSPSNEIMLAVRKRKGLKPQPNVITGPSQKPYHTTSSPLLLSSIPARVIPLSKVSRPPYCLPRHISLRRSCRPSFRICLCRLSPGYDFLRAVLQSMRTSCRLVLPGRCLGKRCHRPVHFRGVLVC